jgi:hypothetical protein
MLAEGVLLPAVQVALTKESGEQREWTVTVESCIAVLIIFSRYLFVCLFADFSQQRYTGEATFCGEDRGL